MRSTRAEEVRSQAVSPESIFGAGGAWAAAAGDGAGACCWAQPSPTAETKSTKKKTANVSVEPRAITTASPPLGLERRFVALTRADSHRRFDRVHEDLPVADVARLGGPGHDIHHFRDQVIGHHHLHLDLGEEVHRVFPSAVQLRVALLTAEAPDLGDRHPDHPDPGQGFFHVIQLERLGHPLDLFSDGPPPWVVNSNRRAGCGGLRGGRISGSYLEGSGEPAAP